MQNITTKDEYQTSLSSHKKISQYTVWIFIFSLFTGYTGLSFLVFDLINDQILSLVLFIFCSIVSFWTGMLFLLSFMETKSLETKLIEYSELKRIQLNLKSVKALIINSILFLCLLIFLTPFLGHAIKYIYNSFFL